ncbi:MAG: asparagine synthase (glutamine-hydrolyzing) [Patescibacteria group bacterium]
MCAIAGCYGNQHRKWTKDALALMRHRGPDETTIQTFPDKKFSVGTNRLAIRDLHRGLYPFSYKGLSLIYNGELYNVQEIVKSTGYRPKTHCDGEIILPAFFQYGASCLDQFVGMFAMAIYDSASNTLVLARDKFGEKPLYYSVTEDEVFFGSELKIFAGRSFSPEAIRTYLSFGYQPLRTTIYKNVYKVLPGEVVTIELSNRSVDRQLYGKKALVNNRRTPDDYVGRSDDAIRSLDKTLNTIVKEKVVSDAPLGVFLSGGVDSALLTALVKRHTRQPVQTFSVAFDHPRYDESFSSQVVARCLQTQHTEIVMTGGSIRGVWDEVVKNLDEPFADPAIFPTYLLSREAKKHVKVILSGEGADELFGGYPHYRNALHQEGRVRVPRWLAEIAMSIRPSTMLASLIGWPDMLYTSARHNIDLHAGVRFRRQHLRLLRQAWSELENNHQLSSAPPPLRLMQYDLRYYVAEQLCMKIDKMTMLHSIESRAPYLDERLMQFMGLSSDLLRSGYQNKYLLRSVAQNYLPAEITNREKHGFSLPLEHWLRGELRDIVEQAFVPHEYLQEALSKETTSTIINGFLSQQHNDALAVWNIVIADAWLKMHAG